MRTFLFYTDAYTSRSTNTFVYLTALYSSSRRIAAILSAFEHTYILSTIFAIFFCLCLSVSVDGINVFIVCYSSSLFNHFKLDVRFCVQYGACHGCCLFGLSENFSKTCQPKTFDISSISRRPLQTRSSLFRFSISLSHPPWRVE